MSSAYSGSSRTQEGHEGQSISVGRAEALNAAVLAFRRFRVYPTARRVSVGDREIALGGRAFDLLVALLRARGKVVSQFEIERQVWPARTIDSSNLRFQMTVLRRALGADRDVIKTIRGRGYLMVDDCDPAPARSIEAGQLLGECRADHQFGILDRVPDEFVDLASPTDCVSYTRMARALSPREPGRLAGDMPRGIGAPRPLAVGEVDPGDVSQRLADLEQENVWLKLAIANLTLKRMAQILPQDV